MFELFNKKALTQHERIELEVQKWKISAARRVMFEGERYYRGEHDILHRHRMVIGRDGELTEAKNLPNNKIIDNQYMKMVDQKVSYLFGRPLTFDANNDKYVTALEEAFGNIFQKTLKTLCENALNAGIAWLYVYYEQGKLCFRIFESFEILPFWKDAAHTELEFVLRLYEVEIYDGRTRTITEKIEIYYPDKIEYYVFKNGRLKPDSTRKNSNYFVAADESGGAQGYVWGRVPVIPFKANTKEIPLITRTKSIQDTINLTLSDFANNMQEDSRNTILVLKNYDGTNLAEFRYNLATYGVVKVRSVDGTEGGVDTLQVEVNADNYKAILEILKKAMIENAMGFDAKSDKLSGTPNQLNIRSMYADMDLSADAIEIEFQTSLRHLIELINIHLVNTKQVAFSDESVKIIFNRDTLINESESISNCRASVGILSNETIVSQHPWVSDVEKELQRVESEQDAGVDAYDKTFDAGYKE